MILFPIETHLQFSIDLCRLALVGAPSCSSHTKWKRGSQKALQTPRFVGSVLEGIGPNKIILCVAGETVFFEKYTVQEIRKWVGFKA